MDFNGQGAASTLSDEFAQLALLDEWAGTKALRQKFERLSTDLATQFNKVKNAVELLPGEREELDALLEEYYAVDPEPSEDVALKAELRRLESSRVAVEMCGSIISTIAGERGARGLLREAAHEVKGLIAAAERRAENVSSTSRGNEDEDEASESEPGLDEASLQGLNDALDLLYQAEQVAENAEENVGKYAQALASSPHRREEAQARLRELDRLFKALRVRTADAAIEAAQAAQERLEAAEIGEEEREENIAELERLRKATADCAFQLALARREAAGALRGAVTSALTDLEMAGSRFDVTLSWNAREGANEETNGNVLRVPRASEIGEDDHLVYAVRPTGLDRATFLLAAGQNEPLRPMASIASGGEKARLMLALKMAPVMTEDYANVRANRELAVGGISVFDEVDSGVGGRVGARIGHALRRLTTTGSQQVLCVTHLPQVAACGDAHLIVSKSPDAGAAAPPSTSLASPRATTESRRSPPCSASATSRSRIRQSSRRRGRGGVQLTSRPAPAVLEFLSHDTHESRIPDDPLHRSTRSFARFDAFRGRLVITRESTTRRRRRRRRHRSARSRPRDGSRGEPQPTRRGSHDGGSPKQSAQTEAGGTSPLRGNWIGGWTRDARVVELVERAVDRWNDVRSQTEDGDARNDGGGAHGGGVGGGRWIRAS